MHIRNKARIITAVAALTIVATACGDDDEADSTDSTASTDSTDSTDSTRQHRQHRSTGSTEPPAGLGETRAAAACTTWTSPASAPIRS